MTLTDRFLKAKHWHIFLLTCGLPIIFQIVMMGTMFANIGSGNAPDPDALFSIFYVFPVLIIIFTGTFFGWFWAIGIGLQSKVPANVTMKTGKFKVFFFIPFVYILLFSIIMGTFITGLADTVESGEPPNPGLILGSMAVVFPLHLFSMFCIFYCLYFVSKTFKTVELQRETTFSDFAGEFFLIWFYPIGIWIIQPKINKMFANIPPGQQLSTEENVLDYNL
jgi:hypothetical protein